MPTPKPLVFIDTNILLDGYRPDSSVALAQLQKIPRHLADIVTTDQVHMEFLKHRQEVMLDSFGRMKKYERFGAFPAFLREDDAVKNLTTTQNAFTKNLAQLQKRFGEILLNPKGSDPVLRIAQAMFSNNDDSVNLKRPNEKRHVIRELARKRWELGYPPRKKSDTSIGDAINWEWIVHCAKAKRRNVIIVSRDGDYGATVESVAYLSDWLRNEFSDRTAQEARLERSLGKALQEVGETVTEEEIRGEESEIEHLLPSFTAPAASRALALDVNELSALLERVFGSHKWSTLPPDTKEPPGGEKE